MARQLARVPCPAIALEANLPARAKLESTIAAKRFGKTEEFGDMCAYLCSQQASFISGQNIQIDGGSYRGLI